MTYQPRNTPIAVVSCRRCPVPRSRTIFGKVLYCPVPFAQWFSWVGGFLLSLISRFNSLWKCPNEHFGLLFRTPYTQEIDGLTLLGRPSTLVGCRPRIDAVLSPVFGKWPPKHTLTSTREAKIRSFCIQTVSLEPWRSRHFGLLFRPGPCGSQGGVLCLACSQFWPPSWRHCSWDGGALPVWHSLENVCSVLPIADVGMAFSLAKGRGLSRSRFNRHSPGFNRHSPGFVCSVVRIADAGMAFSLAKDRVLSRCGMKCPEHWSHAVGRVRSFYQSKGMLDVKKPFCVVNSLLSHWRRGKRRTFFVECCQRLGPRWVSSLVFTNLAAWSYALFSLRGLEWYFIQHTPITLTDWSCGGSWREWRHVQQPQHDRTFGKAAGAGSEEPWKKRSTFSHLCNLFLMYSKWQPNYTHCKFRASACFHCWTEFAFSWRTEKQRPRFVDLHAVTITCLNCKYSFGLQRRQAEDPRVVHAMTLASAVEDFSWKTDREGAHGRISHGLGWPANAILFLPIVKGNEKSRNALAPTAFCSPTVLPGNHSTGPRICSGVYCPIHVCKSQGSPLLCVEKGGTLHCWSGLAGRCCPTIEKSSPYPYWTPLGSPDCSCHPQMYSKISPSGPLQETNFHRSFTPN